MAALKFGSAGVTAREIDLSGPVAKQPVGVPAGIIGTSVKGTPFVPITVGTLSDWYAKFGLTDGKKFGPIAVTEWLRNASALTYLRVLGVGDGRQRSTTGTAAGSVTLGGFTVGENQPNSTLGYALGGNTYAVSGTSGREGRTYFLGAFMSESAGSTVFSSAGIQGQGSITPGISNGTSVKYDTAVPIIRGVLMAASGVLPRLSSSSEPNISSAAPAATLSATDANSSGMMVGTVVLLDGGVAKQDFVLLLNGHRGLDPLYPNVLTASFDLTSPNYFGNVLNKDPLKYQQAGYVLYSYWDVHPVTAVVTGSGLISASLGAGAATSGKSGAEVAAFLLTGSTARNVGASDIPNYESFTDRFTHAQSPWIMSQKFGGSPSNLFRLIALDAGAGISTTYKVSVENIAPSTDLSYKYGTFDVVLRDWNDQDGNLKPLEQWRALSLDPSNDRYVAKVIGDAHIYFDFDRTESAQKVTIEGNYPNKSNLVRVEVATDVDQSTVDPTALPFGFRGIDHLVTSGSMPMAITSSGQLTSSLVLKRAITPPLPMRTDLTIGSGTKKLVNPLFYWGTQFEHITSLATPNVSTLQNPSLKAFAKYYPNFSTANMNFSVGNNPGAVDTAQNGVIDADRFCLNAFTLENIQVTTASNGLADPAQWVTASYVRGGNIPVDATGKTRRVKADDFTQANRRYLKFTLPMQGGFDGVNIFDKDESEINNNAVVADMNSATRSRDQGPNTRAYMKALDVMKNVVNVDIQLLAIPGIRHPIITNAGINAVEERFDALFLMDIEQLDNTGAAITLDTQLPSVQQIVQTVRNRALNSSFGAAYFPDVVITDVNTKTNVVCPPTVAVLGALALNDAIGHPWFAPAGFTRGALSTVQEARVKLSKTNMDDLYDVNVNPLVAFVGNATSGTSPKGGVVVWGQKTLQASASALDRVNVRRLLIELRRQVREISQTIIFEPNRDATLARFSAAVTPRLQRIQALAGLERFKVIIDSSTTSQQDIENNTIRGKIFVQPTKTIEYVSLDFVVSNAISLAT